MLGADKSDLLLVESDEWLRGTGACRYLIFDPRRRYRHI